MRNDDTWTTDAEIKFIRGMGTGIFRDKGQLSECGRPALLRRYREALKKRENWGAMDKQTVIAFLESEIALAEAWSPIKTN